jgi:Family of unknown function (DUF5856)
MNEIPDKLIQFQQQARMLHWQTKSYARHKAYGEYYDGLSDLIDSFVEVHMGKYGRVKTSGSIEVKNLEDVSVSNFISEIKDYLLGLSGEYDADKDSDLLNIRDEMLALTNKLKYLLTLK